MRSGPKTRRMVEFLVHRERKLDVKADVAIRRLERLGKENLQLEDEALEASLQDALADTTKVAKLLVDKWFVDKGFGFGKVPSGEVVFTCASSVQGAEVLMIGTGALVQVVNDDARAQGGFQARRAWGKAAWEQERDRERASRAAERARRAAALSAELAGQSERAVSEVCTHPPGLLRDEPTAECSVAPTTADSPFLAGGNSLLSEQSSLAPSPCDTRARSITRNVDAKSLVDVVLDFYVKATGEDGVQMRPEARKHESSRAAAKSRAVAKASRGGAALPGQKRRRRGPFSEDKEAWETTISRSSSNTM